MRVVDTESNPVADAQVAVEDALFRRFGFPCLKSAPEVASVGPQGEVEIRVEDGRPRLLWVWAPSYGHEEAQVRCGDEVVFMLGRGTWLRVDVSAGGAPLEGARLRLRPEETHWPEWTGWTDSGGSWSFGGFREGAYQLIADHDSYARDSRITRLGKESQEVEVHFTPGAEVCGRVVDKESGGPVGGALVSLHHIAHKEVTTTVDGRFKIHGVPSGAWRLHARAPGYGVATEAVETQGNTSVRDLCFELHRARRLSGRVVDADGPVEGAVVLCSAFYKSGAVNRDDHRAVTGEDGRFELLSLRKDVKYDVLIVSPRGERKRVEVSPGRDSLDLGEVGLVSGHVLAGRVLDEYEEEVAGVKVELSGGPVEVVGSGRGRLLPGVADLVSLAMRGAFETEQAITDEKGRFEFGGLPDGCYTLATSGCGTASTEQEVHVDGSRNLDIVTVRGARVEGLVSDLRDGTCLAGVRVAVVWTAAAALPGRFCFKSREVHSDRKGAFVISGVPPGRLVLRAERAGYQAAQQELLVLGVAQHVSLVLARSPQPAKELTDPTPRAPQAWRNRDQE